ncbi:MAG: radical SAM protein [Gemmatimonadota bacterium]
MTVTAPGFKEALALALPTEGERLTSRYRVDEARPITRRGILWLGQTCNLRCEFCYFLDRIVNDDHPEHGFMSLEKAKSICRTLVEYYGNNSIDIQGGEPTLYPRIFELVAYCAGIGLSPTLITNAQALSNRDVAVRYRDAGIRDFLVSVQGLGDVYDSLVGRDGAHVRQMKGLRSLQEVGIPFRFNTVLSRPVLPQLPDIAELAVRTGAEVVNFLGFNPFNDQTTGKRTARNVPTYTDVGRALDPVLDYLEDAGIEVNVRYLPLCIVGSRHRSSMYNFQQIPWDLHENDFASWSWTDLPSQRMKDAELSPPFGLGPRLRLGGIRGPLRRSATRFPRLARVLHAVKQRIERGLAARESRASREARYRADARMRAEEYTGYRHVSGCADCDASPICDGFYGDYADIFGSAEARPITIGRRIDDPQHFTKSQKKKLHSFDQYWVRGGS